MSFLTLSIADMLFLERELIWKSYTTAKALLTIKQIEFINKKEFVKVAFDKNSKTFVMYIAVLEILLSVLLIHLDKEAQIAFLLF